MSSGGHREGDRGPDPSAGRGDLAAGWRSWAEAELDASFPSTRPKLSYDTLGPLYGYRVFAVLPDKDRKVKLGPLLKPVPFVPGEAARCYGGRARDGAGVVVGHDPIVPAAGCTCGYWVLRRPTFADAAATYQQRDVVRGLQLGTHVLVRVKLYGKVIPHERGWRAQFIEPVEVYNTLASASALVYMLEWVIGVAAAYGLGSPMAPPEGWDEGLELESPEELSTWLRAQSTSYVKSLEPREVWYLRPTFWSSFVAASIAMLPITWWAGTTIAWRVLGPVALGGLVMGLATALREGWRRSR